MNINKEPWYKKVWIKITGVALILGLIVDIFNFHMIIESKINNYFKSKDSTSLSENSGMRYELKIDTLEETKIKNKSIELLGRDIIEAFKNNDIEKFLDCYPKQTDFNDELDTTNSRLKPFFKGIKKKLIELTKYNGKLMDNFSIIRQKAFRDGINLADIEYKSIDTVLITKTDNFYNFYPNNYQLDEYTIYFVRVNFFENERKCFINLGYCYLSPRGYILLTTPKFVNQTKIGKFEINHSVDNLKKITTMTKMYIGYK